MKSLLEVLREKELQLKILTDQIEKLRAAARILEEEGIMDPGKMMESAMSKQQTMDPVRIDATPVGSKKVWP
jgi:hypothetical protein